MKTNFWLLLAILFICVAPKTNAQSADLILVNGKVFTSDSTDFFVEAIAIKGNKILAVGSNSDIEKLAVANTKRIDLKGRTVVPGFNDAHDHLGWLVPVGQSYITEFSVEGLTKDAVIDSLSRLVKNASPNQWIQGTIGIIVFNDSTVRRKLLDSIAPNNPIVLQTMWGHGMIVNSKALEIVNISDTATDPLSGWYEREAGSNYITGALYEGSQFPFWEAVTISEPANIVKALRSYADQQLAFGITTVQNISANFQGNAARRIFKEADLPVRTRIIATPGSTEAGRSLDEWENKYKVITPLTYVSGIKYIIDGTPIEQTALMSTAYRNGWYGKMNFPLDTIKQILHEALISDTQLMMHIVGDSSSKVVLQMMKGMASDDQWKSKRVRIEHGNGLLTSEVLKDVKDMGLIIVHTPQYGTTHSLRSQMEMGIPIAIGPDAIMNPFLGIMIMSSQQSNPNENITREQAVIAYTKGSAFAEFTEKEKGSLSKGMLADIAVLSQDIFTIPTDQLPNTRSLMTIINGKIIYQQPEGLVIGDNL